jgi:hypothetical protein
MRYRRRDEKIMRREVESRLREREVDEEESSEPLRCLRAGSFII